MLQSTLTLEIEKSEHFLIFSKCYKVKANKVVHHQATDQC